MAEGVQFAPDPPQGCSHYVCRNGHTWLPKMALTRCEGCQAQVLLVQVVNCPVCNEPIERMVLTVHHIPNGGGVAKDCLGEKSAWDVVKVEMDRHTWEQVENAKDIAVLSNEERSNSTNVS